MVVFVLEIRTNFIFSENILEQNRNPNMKEFKSSL